MSDSSARIKSSVSDTAHVQKFLAATGAVSSYTLYQGQLVNVNSTGYLVNAADTSGHIFAGLVYEAENILVDDATTKVSVVRPDNFVINFDRAGVQSDIGKLAYVSDNQTVATGGSNVACGRIIEIGANANWVRVRTGIGI